MDGNQDEPDAPRSVKDDTQGLRAPDVDLDKPIFCMSGVMDCLSTVVSLFTRTDLKPANDDEWVVPLRALSNFVYLGRGAQGIVSSAFYRGEMVAVKRLQTRGETDILHLKNLKHENIVRFRGVCTADPYYTIMEYCQYGPLFEFLHSGACFSPNQVLNWAKDIAHGMNYLHSQKIIHRDLKSPNVLIADNLVVKVSDFGTSRVWDEVSAKMSFTGTVAWMAPEVIRHEPCSERVDVWSYGVVLWELLTQEVPYKNLETHAIMWGVGTDVISLPVPSTWPDSLKHLLSQCWNRVPRSRPPFKIIVANLEIIKHELSSHQGEPITAIHAPWRKELQEAVDRFYVRAVEPAALPEETLQRREEIKHARDLRNAYQQQMLRANDMYIEVCKVWVQVEKRERDVADREKALKKCRCNTRKAMKYLQRERSSSSDSVRTTHEPRRRKKESVAAQILVNYVDKPQAQTVSIATKTNKLPDVIGASVQNNNVDVVFEKKDTVVEQNGNVNVKTHAVNDNFKADVAQV